MLQKDVKRASNVINRIPFVEEFKTCLTGDKISNHSNL